MAMLWLPVFALLALAASVTILVVALRRSPSERDVVALAGRTDVPPDEAEVYRRYLGRHERHRLVGGIFGACVAFVVGIGWFQQIRIGVGGGSPLGDLLFCSLAGILVGALSAETFRLSEPRSSVVAASLQPRPGAPRPGVVRTARVLTVASLLGAVVVLLVGHGGDALLVAALGLGMAAVAEATRRAVHTRRRPVLSERAQVVDARIRSFADASVSWLQLAAAVLVASWVLSSADLPAPGPVLGGLLAVAVLGGLVVTVVLLRRARPRAAAAPVAE